MPYAIGTTAARIQLMLTNQSHQSAPSSNKYLGRIRELNDAFRRTFIGGTLMITSGVEGLSPHTRALLLHQVRQFHDFEAGGDPYGEHDFGAIELEDTRFFWKIDYYNRELDGGSEDPVDPAKTTRVLTIMAASEY